MLIVGHTHTAIDQMFSVMHKYKEHNHIVTTGEWIGALDAAYPSTGAAEHKPTIAVVDSVTDWKNWFESSMAAFAGHSKPNYFRFARW